MKQTLTVLLLALCLGCEEEPKELDWSLGKAPPKVLKYVYDSSIGVTWVYYDTTKTPSFGYKVDGTRFFYPFDSDIKIGTHNGDILMDSAVKNVYINKK